jgi:hypothetical protein
MLSGMLENWRLKYFWPFSKYELCIIVLSSGMKKPLSKFGFFALLIVLLLLALSSYLNLDLYLGKPFFDRASGPNPNRSRPAYLEEVV